MGLNPPVLPGKEMALEGLMQADYLLEIRPSLEAITIGLVFQNNIKIFTFYTSNTFKNLSLDNGHARL